MTLARVKHAQLVMERAPLKHRHFLEAIGRAAGGAIFFSLPLLMTMEMWHLGFSMPRVPLLLFMLLMFPVLVGLDRVSGFEETSRWIDDIVDACIAYGVGLVMSVVILGLLNVIYWGQSVREVVGAVALASVPASFGAVIAASQFGANGDGESQEERKRKEGGYGTELFLMVAGAIFFAFNVAPTEEMVELAYQMTSSHALLLAALTLAAIYAFEYSVGFSGGTRRPQGIPAWSLALRFTAPAYAISLLVSAYVLWTFGRYEGVPPILVVREAVVLAFPAGIGAAGARLLI